MCLLAVAAASPAQNTEFQLRPELDTYVQVAPLLRLELLNLFIGNTDTGDWHGNFTFFAEMALKPVLRPRLRNQPNVYQRRYLTFGAGYRYRVAMPGSNTATENRILLDLTARYPLPLNLLISSRNRGEFRFIRGQSFFTRYRNRLRLEYDFERGRFEFIPYGDVEAFYDSRYNAWTPWRYELGAQFPVGSHVVLEPYYLRDHSSQAPPARTNALGFKLSLFF